MIAGETPVEYAHRLVRLEEWAYDHGQAVRIQPDVLRLARAVVAMTDALDQIRHVPSERDLLTNAVARAMHEYAVRVPEDAGRERISRNP